METLGESPSAVVELAVAGPIAVVEVMLSVWLIARGFNPSLATADPKTTSDRGR